MVFLQTLALRNQEVNMLCYAKSLQSCRTLCDPIDGSPPGSPIPGILQARTLEWVAISFSNAWKWKVKVKSLSRVRLFATPWTAAHQAPPSMGFSRQEYWSGVPLPSPKGKHNMTYYSTKSKKSCFDLLTASNEEAALWNVHKPSGWGNGESGGSTAPRRATVCRH